jgi:hypothetical protein
MTPASYHTGRVERSEIWLRSEDADRQGAKDTET